MSFYMHCYINNAQVCIAILLINLNIITCLCFVVCCYHVMHTKLHTCICMYLHNINLCTYVHVYVYVYMYSHTYTYAYLLMRLHAYIVYVCMYVYVHSLIIMQYGIYQCKHEDENSKI